MQGQLLCADELVASESASHGGSSKKRDSDLQTSHISGTCRWADDPVNQSVAAGIPWHIRLASHAVSEPLLGTSPRDCIRLTPLPSHPTYTAHPDISSVSVFGPQFVALNVTVDYLQGEGEDGPIVKFDMDHLGLFQVSLCIFYDVLVMYNLWVRMRSTGYAIQLYHEEIQRTYVAYSQLYPLWNGKFPSLQLFTPHFQQFISSMVSCFTLYVIYVLGRMVTVFFMYAQFRLLPERELQRWHSPSCHPQAYNMPDFVKEFDQCPCCSDEPSHEPKILVVDATHVTLKTMHFKDQSKG